MSTTCKQSGRLRIASRDKQFLWASSGGYCANPKCRQNLFAEVDGLQVPFGELAHIISASEGGPRDIKLFSSTERASTANILMLCANCHTVVDKEPDHFPISDLRRWQEQHLRSINSLFGCERFHDREEARSAVSGLLAQNRAVFDRYGPGRQKDHGRHGAEPVRVWRRKTVEVIVPNNRRLLGLLDCNAHLLTDGERLILEDFRNHVDDVEARQIRGLAETDAVTFPSAIDEVLT